MSGVPPAKRQRTNTIGTGVPVPGTLQIVQSIQLLPQQTIHNILVLAAQQHPDVAANLKNELARIRAAESAKTIDFDGYSKTAWKAINVTYSRMSGSKQYDFAGEAFDTVNDCIETIRKLTPTHASFGTKKSALETLRKIGKTICLSSNDVVGHEVQKNFEWNTCLERTMLRIAESMPVDERKKVLTTEFNEKLVELEKLGNDHCVFEKLADVREVLASSSPPKMNLEGDEDSDGDGEEDDDSGEEEDDDDDDEDGEELEFDGDGLPIYRK